MTISRYLSRMGFAKLRAPRENHGHRSFQIFYIIRKHICYSG